MADLTPVEHPGQVEITAAAHTYLGHAQAAVDEHAADWERQLDRYGLHPDELHIIPAAIALRRQRLTSTLIGEPPGWLTWWYGPRPADPVGAQVWDDEIGQLAAWRDARHLPAGTPGYGPPPDNPAHLRRWREHLDRSLATRTWLHDHTTALPPPTPAVVDITVVRARITELDAIIATAPADQRKIIDDLHHTALNPADVHHALVDAAATQTARRDWILEHWPHVVEHTELTPISTTHDSLAHWPTPTNPDITRRLHALQAISIDTPEPQTLPDLDAQIAEHHPG